MTSSLSSENCERSFKLSVSPLCVRVVAMKCESYVDVYLEHSIIKLVEESVDF